MEYFGSVIERYCTVLGRNVPVEIVYQPSGGKEEHCLQKHLCLQQRGACTGFNRES